MLDILTNGFGWVTLIYGDGSKKILKTTLNTQILNREGLAVLDDKLYDFEKKVYVSLPENARLEITADRPVLSEVDEFANRFI